MQVVSEFHTHTEIQTPHMHKKLMSKYFFKSYFDLGMVVLACYLIVQEADVKYYKFETSQGYIARSCVRKKKNA